MFVTTYGTLTRDRDTMLAALILFPAETQDGQSFFIDRDPTYFRHILNFLRDGAVETDGVPLHQIKALLREARFYHVRGLSVVLEEFVNRANAKEKAKLSDEKIYKLMAVEPSKLNEVFANMTAAEGYDFEHWIGNERGVHVLFSKKLSRGELMLLDRLQNDS